MPAKKPAADKVFDVAKPGTSKPDIGSKPMIVGHKSMASDPMMREAESENADGKEVSGAPKVSSSKIKIQPLTEQESEAVTESTKPEPEAAETVVETSVKIDEQATVDSAETAEPPSADSKGESSEEVEEQPEKTLPKETLKPVQPKEEAEVDAKSDEKSADEKPKENAKLDGKDDAVDPAVIASEREENLRKIIDSKKYRLNIKETKDRSSKNTIFAALLVLVLGLAGLYALVDMGKLNIGVDVPFHLFNNKSEVAAPAQQAATPVAVQPQSSQSTVSDKPVSEKKTVSNAPLEFSMETPKDWKFTYSDETFKTFGFYTYTYTLPSGTKVVFKPYGGKGGDCTPATSDSPHKAGNNCITTEVLSSTDLATADSTKARLPKESKLVLRKYRITDTGGQSKYFLCIDDVDTSATTTELAVNEPYMGFGLQQCAGIGAVTFMMEIDGPDNSTDAFFKDKDVAEIETAFLTFELL